MNTIFVFIRRLLSIVFLLFVLLLLMLIPQYFDPIDVAALLILSGFISISLLICFKVWPKGKSANKADTSTSVKDNQLNIVTTEIEKMPSDDSEKIETSVEFDHNNSDLDLEPIVPDPTKQTITIHSIVVGIKYEGRSKRLKETINHLKSIGWYEYIYQGMSNSEIKDDIPFRDEEYPVWELTDETLPFAEIVPEPENEFDKNAIAVYVGSSSNEMFKVGYLPKNDSRRIKDLIDNALLIDVAAIITGGRYKFIEFDDYGEEKVRTRTADYLLDLEIYFQKEIV